MKSHESLGRRERAVIDERRTSGYRVDAMRFAADEATLRALVARLLPGVPETIDLAAFVDSHVEDTLGRGDRKPGVPANAELVARGLRELTAREFAALDEGARDSLIERMRRGEADEELGVPAKEFIDRVLTLAAAGYLAHPEAWERIGFNGPAYPEGYAWISRGAVRRRHSGFVGSRRL